MASERIVGEDFGRGVEKGNDGVVTVNCNGNNDGRVTQINTWGNFVYGCT